jgi:DMSO/TMAO reductase YedYZ heme-binding membrane subunit
VAKRANRTWLLYVIGVAALVLIGGGIAARQLVAGQFRAVSWLQRTSALLGYLCVFAAAVSALYMRELVKFFGRSFVKTHHNVTVTGLIVLGLHGLLAVFTLGARVLLPNLRSVRLFFSWGGPIAFYLIGIAALTALWRTSALREQWRYLHWLNYLAFFLATVHAILLGTEFFGSTAMQVIPIVLALILVAAFVLKRRQQAKLRARRRK